MAGLLGLGSNGLVEPGNIDIYNRPVVKNPDGSISTVRSMSFQGPDGLETLVPTVSDSGQLLTAQQAIQSYLKTGKHLGKFNSPEAATTFAQHLHEQQARYYRKPALNTFEGP